MEMMFNKFQVIVTQMKKKPYDYLDQRKMEFDSDFEDFKRQINDLHVSEIYSFQYKGRIYRSVADPGLTNVKGHIYRLIHY